jgi:hypothetical protein
MNNNSVSQITKEVAALSDALKQCISAGKGVKTFKNNPTGLGFCADQLYQGALTVRSHADELITLADNLRESLGIMPAQLELDNIS